MQNRRIYLAKITRCEKGRYSQQPSAYVEKNEREAGGKLCGDAAQGGSGAHRHMTWSQEAGGPAMAMTAAARARRCARAATAPSTASCTASAASAVYSIRHMPPAHPGSCGACPAPRPGAAWMPRHRGGSSPRLDRQRRPCSCRDIGVGTAGACREAHRSFQGCYSRGIASSGCRRAGAGAGMQERLQACRGGCRRAGAGAGVQGRVQAFRGGCRRAGVGAGHVRQQD